MVTHPKQKEQTGREYWGRMWLNEVEESTGIRKGRAASMLATLRTTGFVFQMSFRRENINGFLFKKILTAVSEVGNCEGTPFLSCSGAAGLHLNEAPPFLSAPPDLKSARRLSRSLPSTSPPALVNSSSSRG